MPRGAVIPSIARNLQWLLVVIPALASAQVIRGTVVDRAGAPVGGVVVLLLDQRDSVTSRALSSESGEFRVMAASAGLYRVRTMRIGYRPTISPSVVLATGQEVMQQFELTGLPFSLDTVRVMGRNSCRTTGDSASTTFAIWEQVRTALTATQLTTGVRGIDATLITYERALDPDRERVLSQGSRIISGLTRAPWTSPSADSLRHAGYVVTNLDGTTTYWAPDLKVLLSDQFIEDHCFELATSKDATRIGIAFAPTRERRRVAGIRGTLWLDRKSSELRRMEFRYTNATREQEYGSSGGNMEFVRVKNGAWVISGWNIRMPTLVQRQARVSGLGGGATVAELRVDQIRVEGGEVALVTRNRSDTLWTRTPVPLTGTVADSASGARIANARVVLRGTSLTATTDSIGRFRIADALPGQYTADVRTKTLSAFGYVHSIPLMFTDSTTVHSIRVPSVAQIVETLCPAKDVGAAASRRDGMIAGVVRLDGDTATPRGANVLAQWNDVTPTSTRFGSLDAVVDGKGSFKICGLPLGTKLTVSAALGPAASPVDDAVKSVPGSAASNSIHGSSGGSTYTLRGTRRVASSYVEVSLTNGARFASVELVLDTSLTRGATLAGVVLSDVNGQPIADVEVAILELAKNVFTNERGAFRLDDIAPGRRVVTVRRVGYAVKNDTITFASNTSVERSLLLSRVATLDTVAVKEWAGPADFEEHRKLGLGKFLTRADIDKMQGMSIANRLSELGGGLAVARGTRNQGWVLSGRPGTSGEGYWCPDPAERARRGGIPCACYAKVFVDRTLMNPPEMQVIGGRVINPNPPFDVNTITTMSIEAVEWYSGSASVPPEYAKLGPTSCGVLAIHSRRGK